MSGRKKGLEVDQDLRFQRRDWAFERVGWLLMFLVVIAALLGVFGDGPLSAKEARTSDGSLRVEYGRFERREAPSRISVTVRRGAPADSTVALWVSEDYLRAVRLHEVIPVPRRQIARGDGTVFEVALGGDSGRVSLYFLPERAGARTLRLGVPGREMLALAQFIYP